MHPISSSSRFCSDRRFRKFMPHSFHFVIILALSLWLSSREKVFQNERERERERKEKMRKKKRAISPPSKYRGILNYKNYVIIWLDETSTQRWQSTISLSLSLSLSARVKSTISISSNWELFDNKVSSWKKRFFSFFITKNNTTRHGDPSKGGRETEKRKENDSYLR